MAYPFSRASLRFCSAAPQSHLVNVCALSYHTLNCAPRHYFASPQCQLIAARFKPSGGSAVAGLLYSNKEKRRSGVAFASSSEESTPMAVQKSEDEWRALLSPQQFRILREKATEPPNTGEYNKFYEDGTYKCVGCGTPLYKSTTKFDSGCGWPAFFEGLPGAIKRTPDPDGRRIEITCAACEGHLGHVFKGEGFPTPTDERHCVNSISIKFKPENE